MAIDSDEGIDEEEGDYAPAPASTQDEENADDGGATAPRTNRPGQAGFAQRLMSKYGWEKGAGLGADSSGITTALRVQVEKRRRRPDAEGGGFAEPGARGRIIEGKKKNKKKQGGDSEDGGDGDDAGRFGRMSEVVVLRDMLEGMPDLEAEMEDGLAQEIGEECGERYGRVERLFIDVDSRRVFIKFTDQVSALRVSGTEQTTYVPPQTRTQKNTHISLTYSQAVNALEGRIFNGNTIVPRFYNADKFEQGIYK